MSESDLLSSGAAQTHSNWSESDGGAELNLVAKGTLEGDDNQRERIKQLEQALEQSLASIRELELQLKDQHLLETQLAATEEMANLQQQAINELQRQLMQQSLKVDVAKHPALPERIGSPLKHQPLRVDLPAFLTKCQGRNRG